MAVSKKKVIKSLENLSEDLKQLLQVQYPTGYQGSITRITNAKKEPIFVFPLETDDSTYLVKVPVTKNSDGEYDVESKPEKEFEPDGGDDVAGAEDPSATDADGEDEDDDYEGGGKKNREASYDPDFDA